MEIEEPIILKCLIIGNTRVGKSCILLRYCDGKFYVNPGLTIGVDFRFARTKVNENEVKLQIWDTAGQERFRTITSTYYRSADGIIVVYDVTNIDSFEQVKNWFLEISNNAPPNTAVILAGNKIDLEDQRAITYKEGKNFADSLNCPFMEVSAKTGENIPEIFELISVEMLKRNKKRPKKQSLGFLTEEKNKKNCC
ncbi:small rab-related gtpase [Anaeramoeba ignava]|uniref:Small rab-related gtpase n=1 Tax=Anaeramoeba ignava TaxID=1746090 RepID=A0A9Q0LLZ0_ANAIG|nr:small rab-related gtpase [Anaeramoeba ignava]